MTAFRPLLCSLALLALTACSTTPTSDKAPSATPSTGGFSPLRAQSIAIPGAGAWDCAPSTASALSQCRKTQTAAEEAPQTARRPGLLPVAATGGAPGLPPEGAAFAMPTFAASAEIPMVAPQ